MNPRPIIAVGSGSGVVPGRLIGSSRGIANAGSRLMNLVGSSPPSTPTGLAAVGGTGSIALTCDATAGATSYDWQYSSDGGSTYSALTSTGTPSTTDASAIAHMQATSGKVYYKVRATNGAGSSAYSSAVNASPYKAYTLYPQADGTNISGAALEVGGTWTLLEGAATVQSHNLTGGAGGIDGYTELVTDTGASDVTVTSPVQINTPHTDPFVSVIIRATDINNFIVVQIVWQANTMSLFKRVAGSYTQLATVNVPTINLDQSNTIVISGLGNVLTATLNGGSQITATDAFNNTATKCGYLLGSTCSSSSFKVTSP